MRVIGGAWGGRPLVAPGGRGTRPTSDKVREAIFDTLAALLPAEGLPGGGSLVGHSALDLFAGSGALGIEALSRGADDCTFAENERAALRALRTNLTRLGEAPGRAGGSRSRVLAGDVRRALQADARRGARYTLVFADPPYARYAELESALARLLAPLLAPRAVVVVETARSATVTLPWPVVRSKRYGDTQVTFLAIRGLVQGAEHDDDLST